MSESRHEPATTTVIRARLTEPRGSIVSASAAVQRRPASLAAADTAQETETEKDTKTKLARPWHVIVHDDPVSLMSYVTQVFMDVFQYPPAKARKLMLEVHESGRSVVWTGPRERAELYASKLQAYHLLTTLEQSETG